VNDPEDVFWGDMYMLSVDVGGEEYVTVRRVNRSERKGYVRLSGFDNPHADKEIEVSKIRGIAFIKASIRMNSMI
jgi:ribulose bisphosphate carboxylase small subunit